MRRVARVLLRTLALACVALAILAAVLWSTSYRRVDVVALRVSPSRFVAAGIRHGRLILIDDFRPANAASWVTTLWLPTKPGETTGDPPGMWRGFDLRLDRPQHLIVPAPAAILLLSLSAAAAWRRAARLRPPPDPTRCAACGYDFRATPDRCPECGVAPAR